MSSPMVARLRVGLRWLIALLLLWAAVSKLANPSEFLGSIYAYELPLPRGLVKLAAVTLPWVELLCALLLLANHWTEGALLCVLALFGVFVVATGQAWLRGLHIACGCFDLSFLGQGAGAKAVKDFVESVGVAFFRNLLLTAGVLWLLRTASAPASLPPEAGLRAETARREDSGIGLRGAQQSARRRRR